MERTLLAAGMTLLLSAGHAEAMTREASLINSFEVLCTLEPPNFQRIEQKAEAMKMASYQDVAPPKETDGSFDRTKSWIVTLTDGPHVLFATEMNGPKGHVVSCGIGANDPIGASFKKELMTEMKLGSPTVDGLLSNGMHVYLWKGTFGPGTQLRLQIAEPDSNPGAMVGYDIEGPPVP